MTTFPSTGVRAMASPSSQPFKSTIKRLNAAVLIQISVTVQNHLFGLRVLVAVENVPLLDHSKWLWAKGT